MTNDTQGTDDFRNAGAHRPSLASELWAYLKHSKKWWLLPILLTILILGLLVILGGTGAAPFIYTIF